MTGLQLYFNYDEMLVTETQDSYRAYLNNTYFSSLFHCARMHVCLNFFDTAERKNMCKSQGSNKIKSCHYLNRFFKFISRDEKADFNLKQNQQSGLSFCSNFTFLIS